MLCWSGMSTTSCSKGVATPPPTYPAAPWEMKIDCALGKMTFSGYQQILKKKLYANWANFWGSCFDNFTRSLWIPLLPFIHFKHRLFYLLSQKENVSVFASLLSRRSDNQTRPDWSVWHNSISIVSSLHRHETRGQGVCMLRWVRHSRLALNAVFVQLPRCVSFKACQCVPDTGRRTSHFGVGYQEFQHSTSQMSNSISGTNCGILWFGTCNCCNCHKHKKCCKMQLLVKIHTGIDSVSVFTASPETKSMNQSAGFSAGGISKPRP